MHGTVRGADGIGLPGMIVSNGQDTVRTDDDGTYTLPERGRFVFVSRPEGFTTTRWWFPATPGPVDFDLVERQQSLPFEIVHLTDTHLSVPGGVAEDTERKRRSMYPEGGLSDQFTTLLRSLPSTVPDAQAIFLTGDLVDTGVSDEYEALIEALEASPLPVHAIPGNHDHMNGRNETVLSPNNYLTNVADPSAYERHLGPRWYSFDLPGLHVVAMDWHTHELGLDNVVQEEWLRNDLALVSPDTPWALLFHDQPNDTLLTNVPRPPVATFSGHWHTSRVVRVDGTLHVNTAPTLFAGLDYSPPSLRRAVWDGTEFTLDTVALHSCDDARLAPALSKSTIASSPMHRQSKPSAGVPSSPAPVIDKVCRSAMAGSSSAPRWRTRREELSRHSNSTRAASCGPRAQRRLSRLPRRSSGMLWSVSRSPATCRATTGPTARCCGPVRHPTLCDVSRGDPRRRPTAVWWSEIRPTYAVSTSPTGVSSGGGPIWLPITIS